MVLYHFYPRSPCGERLLSGLRFSRLRDFYPRSPCGERPQIFYRVGIAINISIHALLAESDDRYAVAAVSDEIISIHALLAESDHAFAFALKTSDYFYPRSPCGERQQAGPPLYRLQDISIHALLAESDKDQFDVAMSSAISIHALLAESDYFQFSPCPPLYGFLSTLSLRRATGTMDVLAIEGEISIHALLAESDA